MPRNDSNDIWDKEMWSLPIKIAIVKTVFLNNQAWILGQLFSLR